MGLVYADIELVNSGDLEMVRRNVMDKDEVRHININMLADSGAYMMAINFRLCWCFHQQLCVSTHANMTTNITNSHDLGFRPCWSFLQQATVRFVGENSNKGEKMK